jgi:hypothetical protein
MILGFSNFLRAATPYYYVDLPSFQRDFASLKTLDHGTGPNITFTRASDATYFDADGVLQTATTNTPRFDHDPATGASRGLLIEEARTNSIRNSQAGGSTNGVIGSGGVMPTNWSSGLTVNGLSTEILGTGTEDGLSYIDLKISGTPTTTSSHSIVAEPVFQIVASNGQTWTNSYYVRLVNGALTNVTLQVYLAGRTAAGATVSGQTASTSITPTSAALKTQRYSATLTMSSASVERVSPQIIVNYTNAQAIDLTLRIAAPQLEQGAFATSYIPTTTAAATRAADLALVNSISSFYNQSEGTLFAEWSAVGLPDVPSINIDNTTQSERILLLINANSLPAYFVGSSNTTQASVTVGSAVTVGQIVKAAGAAKANDFIAAVGGVLSANDTNGVMPNVTRLSIGQRATNANGNGHIRKIAYWPKRLSNTLLQQLTT